MTSITVLSSPRSPRKKKKTIWNVLLYLLSLSLRVHYQFRLGSNMYLFKSDTCWGSHRYIVYWIYNWLIHLFSHLPRWYKSQVQYILCSKSISWEVTSVEDNACTSSVEFITNSSNLHFLSHGRSPLHRYRLSSHKYIIN